MSTNWAKRNSIFLSLICRRTSSRVTSFSVLRAFSITVAMLFPPLFIGHGRAQQSPLHGLDGHRKSEPVFVVQVEPGDPFDAPQALADSVGMHEEDPGRADH